MKRGTLFTKLNLHFALLGLAVAADVFLAVKFGLAWEAIRSGQSGAYVQEELRYGQLEAQMQHLNGLPAKVEESNQDAQKFFDGRIAPDFSTILAQLGSVASKNHVRLSRAGYSPSPSVDGLAEVRIDAGLSGQYTDLMHFINDLERDKDHVFFVIDGVTLSGQQGGLVNLRLRLRTYLRASATDLPPASGSRADLEPAAAEVTP
jgi:type IV pilus assembly protein PilO